jgi:hypothetical protein
MRITFPRPLVSFGVGVGHLPQLSWGWTVGPPEPDLEARRQSELASCKPCFVGPRVAIFCNFLFKLASSEGDLYMEVTHDI